MIIGSSFFSAGDLIYAENRDCLSVLWERCSLRERNLLLILKDFVKTQYEGALCYCG